MTAAELINICTPIVNRIAAGVKARSRSQIDINDLKQAGYLGALEWFARDKYDKHIPIEAMVWWPIKTAMYGHIRFALQVKGRDRKPLELVQYDETRDIGDDSEQLHNLYLHQRYGKINDLRRVKPVQAPRIPAHMDIVE